MSAINKDDTKYVVTYRLVRHADIEKIIGKVGSDAVWYYSGKKFGELAVEKGMVKNFDDLKNFAFDQRIGLVDLYEESNDKLRIHVYECIGCSGIPNINRAVCQFEGGLIAGAISKFKQINE
jgi:predicted hydrocarbon binding protein